MTQRKKLLHISMQKKRKREEVLEYGVSVLLSTLRSATLPVFTFICSSSV